MFLRATLGRVATRIQASRLTQCHASAPLSTRNITNVSRPSAPLTKVRHHHHRRRDDNNGGVGREFGYGLVSVSVFVTFLFYVAEMESPED